MPTTKPLPRKKRVINRGLLYTRTKDDVKNPKVTLLDIDTSINFYFNSVIKPSVEDNGEGYTITGEGAFANGPIQGSVHGTINTDPNFAPDFSSLSMGGEASVDTEVAGNQINVSAEVNNGYLENISGTVEITKLSSGSGERGVFPPQEGARCLLSSIACIALSG